MKDFLHKFHSYVHYEEVYQCKRFQKLSIKSLTTIAYLNFKNEQKIGLSILGAKHVDEA